MKRRVVRKSRGRMEHDFEGQEKPGRVLKTGDYG